MTLKSYNPYTGELIEEFTEFTDEEVDTKIAISAGAFDDWRKTSFEYRKTLMLKVADQLKSDAYMLGKTISLEMGKTITEAQAEVVKCAWVCEYYATNAMLQLKSEAVATEAYKSYVKFEPLGTILGIMPWNFPFWQVFRFAAPTVMAGNVVLLKHSSNVQMCARAIENLFVNAGFPQGVFQNLVVGSGKVKNIIGHNAVKAVTLTGSEEAGSHVAEVAGKIIKKSVLELGGSNSFIVLNDANINKAVEIGVKARMQNAGQSCIAAKRFILLEGIEKQFVKLFLEKVTAIVAGNPLDSTTEIGHLSSVKQAEILKKQVDDSVKLGAEILTGGFAEGAFFHPTIVTNVKPGMPLFDEEVFGPVAAMIRAKDVQEAIRLSNLSKFGLGVSLFTNNLEKAEELIPQFDDGAVFINALVKSDPRLPFGGTKYSGYGRELAGFGIREFVNIKTVYADKFDESEIQAL